MTTSTVGRSSANMAALLQRTLAIPRTALGGTRPVPSSSAILWAVRRDWPIDRTHEFVCARRSRRAAVRQLAKDRAFWRRGPIRPVHSVVAISAHEFALHGRARTICRAPDCAIAIATETASRRA